MTTLCKVGRHGVECLSLDASLGDLHGRYGFSFRWERLPTEPVGIFALTLTNIVVGSRIHVEKQSDGTSFYDAVAATSTVVIPLSVYAAGSAYNDLRIKVRKGSATTYQPWETQATAIVGSQSIYVSQIPDE